MACFEKKLVGIAHLLVPVGGLPAGVLEGVVQMVWGSSKYATWDDEVVLREARSGTVFSPTGAAGAVGGARGSVTVASTGPGAGAARGSTIATAGAGAGSAASAKAESKTTADAGPTFHS